jgi:hypothetical protein
MGYKKIFVIILAFTVSSCSFNDKKYNQEIIGTWDVFMSTLNEKPNGLMKDAYFIFSDDKSVTSNVFEGNQKQSFNVENGVLQIVADFPFEMNIVRLESDTLYLKGKMSYYQMEYYLVKRK